MAQVTSRTVRGMDIVVTYVERDDLLSVKYIQDFQGNNGRFTPELLIESLGFTSQTATMQFVRNNNLHKGGKALQGALLMINLRIGMIVKSMGSYILFQTLFPVRLSGFMIINLMRNNRHYGFFLQQIRGPRLGILSSWRHGGNQGELEPYPYAIDGNVYMSPFGPDFYVTLLTDNIPPSINGEFDAFQDNLSSTCLKKTSSRIKKLRNSQKGNVLYVCADPKSLVKLHKSADMFYVPVGNSLEDDVTRPWKSSDGSLDGRLYKYQDFVTVTKEQMNEIKQWGKLGDSEWTHRIGTMCGKKKKNFTSLIVPSIDWSLNIVLVTQKCMDEIYDSLTAKEKVFARIRAGPQQVEMLFVEERKSITKSRGISISSWVLGDSQVSRTRVTYPYVTAYKKTYGTGFGSRVRSQCLDSVNSYRDKRLNPRAHPSPLIHDREIGEHQYFSHHKQRSCLLQMKLEMVLHSLTTNITFVAERMNPEVVKKVSGLSTKFIATTGKSLYSFCNGLHTDSCDKISKELKSKIFENPTEDVQRMLSFKHCSFPTTCGYQHVWKNNDDKGKYEIQHYFVMPTLGLAVSLDDSICHHFQGGAFAHCTSVCVLYDEQQDITTVLNDEDKFCVFAWGSSANSRTARANIARMNELGGHRDRTDEQRRVADARRSQAAGVTRIAVPAASAAQAQVDPTAPVPAASAQQAQVDPTAQLPTTRPVQPTTGPVQPEIVPAASHSLQVAASAAAQCGTPATAQEANLEQRAIPALTDAAQTPATALAAAAPTPAPAKAAVAPTPAPAEVGADKIMAAIRKAPAADRKMAAQSKPSLPRVEAEVQVQTTAEDEHREKESDEDDLQDEESDNDGDSEYENALEFRFEDESYEEEEPLEKKSRWFP